MFLCRIFIIFICGYFLFGRNEFVPSGCSRIWPFSRSLSFGCPLCFDGSVLPRLRVKFLPRQRRHHRHTGKLSVRCCYATAATENNEWLWLGLYSNCTERRVRQSRRKWVSNLPAAERRLPPHHGREFQTRATVNCADQASRLTPSSRDLITKLMSLKVNEILKESLSRAKF